MDKDRNEKSRAKGSANQGAQGKGRGSDSEPAKKSAAHEGGNHGASGSQNTQGRGGNTPKREEDGRASANQKPGSKSKKSDDAGDDSDEESQ